MSQEKPITYEEAMALAEKETDWEKKKLLYNLAGQIPLIEVQARIENWDRTKGDLTLH